MNARLRAWLPRVASLVLDALVIYLVLGLRSQAWYRGTLGKTGFDDVPEHFWRWGAPPDLLLFGPDAGNWAANARALMEGTTPDLHRLPVYGWATVLAHTRFEDLVFAGHFVNHLAAALVAVVTWFVGRSTSGRGAALGAAIVVAMSPELINAQNLYGVDPLLTLGLILLFASGWWAMKGPWWAVIPAGVVAGTCAATHYLGMLFVLPTAVLLALHDRDRWRRLLGPIALLALAWLVFQAWMRPYPPMSLTQALNVYAEGVVSSNQRPDLVDTGIGSALTLVFEKLDGSTQVAAHRLLKPLLVGLAGWYAVLGAFWLGLVGFGLGDKERRWGWDWRGGMWLLAWLAPLVFMEAARAPDRYKLYAVPLVALAVFRGFASLCRLVELGIARLAERQPLLGHWPRGALALAVCGGLAWSLIAPMKTLWPGIPPTEVGLHERAVGLIIAGNFPSGGGVATPAQAIPFYAGREACPRASCETVASCKALLKARCRGSGDLPYVVDIREREGFADKRNVEMDEWVRSNFEAVGSAQDGSRVTTVYRVPREALSP